MLKNMDLYVTPVLNVDGYMYSWINESVSYLVNISHHHHCSRPIPFIQYLLIHVFMVDSILSKVMLVKLRNNEEDVSSEGVLALFPTGLGKLNHCCFYLVMATSFYSPFH